MKDINIQLSTKTLANIFKQHHLTVFIIFIAAILATVVLLVNTALINPPAPSTPPPGGDAAMVAPNYLDSLRSFHPSGEFTHAPVTSQQSPFSSKGR